mmetsp:Transcript_17736/g.23889  ORF Transcript_17736/g.23889 Transcript_17736/m.23889 type:complete len:250 (+) Transcript_17736:711-1460(+)
MNRGSPLPMSVTSSTANTSKSSASMAIFSLSPSSSSFFFAIAFFLAGSFKSCCFFFHALRPLVHSDHLPLNQSEGCKSSMRCVSFLPRTHLRRYSSHPLRSAQGNLISPKLSSSPGTANFAYADASSFGSMSGESFFLNVALFSSSVSSTLISSCSSSAAAVSALASSSASFFSLSSSASFFPSFVFLAASSLFLRSSCALFFRSSSAFFFASSNFLRFALASAFVFLSLSMASWTQVMYSAGGSPITT